MNKQPKHRGGKRPGAGRKPTGRIKRDVSLPPEVWAAIEDYRQREEIKTTGEAVETLVSLALSHDKLSAR